MAAGGAFTKNHRQHLLNCHIQHETQNHCRTLPRYRLPRGLRWRRKRLTSCCQQHNDIPLDAAYTKAVTNGVSLSGTAVDGADTWTMTMSLTPASDEAFEGVVRKKALQSLTIKKNGTVLAASTIQSYFSVNPFATQGARYSDGTYAVQTSTTGSFASAAKVGDSGSLGIMTLYTNASKTSVQATTEATWTLEADTATTAFGCGNSIVRNSAGVQTGTAAGCYKIDTQGNTLGMRYTLAVAGKTLTFK